MIGRTIGQYQVIDKIGEGGMGLVYRATDTRLNRDVAIKVLPAQFADDDDRLERFEREAQLLASLNHPNIATIHSIEEFEDQRLIIMELVSGDTLADRLQSDRLNQKEVLKVFRQISAGLEAAHERGIIHRDLKPANVIVQSDGLVKILDFGLAKVFRNDTREPEPVDDSTIVHSLTGEGVIFGTASYMSPEQIRGREFDRRVDIWAFGCMLFEALSGQKVFRGDSIPEILATILGTDPEWNALPKSIPSGVENMLQRCLRKDPQLRLRDIGDARIALEEAITSSSITANRKESTAPGFLPEPKWALPWLITISAIAIALISVQSRSRRSGAPVPPGTMLTTPVGSEAAFSPGSHTNLAISPDGEIIAYAALDSSDTFRLHIRRLTDPNALMVPGVEDVNNPFFSPDGRWIGFMAGTILMKVQSSGGVPQPITTIPFSAGTRGAAWGHDDNIIFVPSEDSGLWTVSADGGIPEALLVPDTAAGERSLRWPSMLPGDRGILLTLAPPDISTFDDAWIAVYSNRSGEKKRLVRGSDAQYLPSGHLVFTRSGTLFGVPFDISRFEIVGSPVSLVEDVATSPVSGGAQYAVSENGTLLYARGGEIIWRRELVWVDRDGSYERVIPEQRAYNPAAISPDGTRIAAEVQAATNEIWVGEISRGILEPLTHGGENTRPLWTPDGSKITFRSSRSGYRNLFWQAIDGRSSAEQLTDSEFDQIPTSWHPSGNALLFDQRHPTGERDIWILKVDDGWIPEPHIATESDEFGAVFSPDGDYIAFTSNDTGERQVYVQQFQSGGRGVIVSPDGGYRPQWSPDSKELFYLKDSILRVSSITLHPELHIGPPRILTSIQFNTDTWGASYAESYQVHPVSGRFLVVRSYPRLRFSDLNLILNWFEEIEEFISPD